MSELILTRRPGEKILIGENVVVTLKGFNGTSAVLGIEAPKDVVILREEIKDKKFEPKVDSGEKKKKAPFLKAHKAPKAFGKKSVSQAVAGAISVINEEVKAL